MTTQPPAPDDDSSTVRVTSSALNSTFSSRQRNDQPYVSPALVAGAAWSWRILVLLAAGFVLLKAVTFLKVVVIPVALALLFTVLLQPLDRFLHTKARFPRGASAATSVLLLIAAIAGLLTVAGRQIAQGITELSDRAVEGVNELISWAQEAPLNLELGQLDAYWNDLLDAAQAQSGVLLSGALSVTSTIGHVLAGALITLFCTVFFLIDGRKIWTWLVGLLPRHLRERTHQAGRRGLVTLSAYVRTQILVAFIDSVGIGLGAAIIGLPLVVPLAALVFIGSFIPFVGAIVTGAVAVLVALVVKGWFWALVMLGIVLLVQQIEGNVLQPFLMGRAVAIHPVAVLLTVTAGTIMAGIIGAIFAVPLVALVNTVVLYFNGHDKFPELGFDDRIPMRPTGRKAVMVTSATRYVSDEEQARPPATMPYGAIVGDTWEKFRGRFWYRQGDMPATGEGASTPQPDAESPQGDDSPDTDNER
ncbi:AI-2E family transporter [Jonesia quinghaiensis]|uniref:AI-2E family transporter n=1 Tax=Jonesia quinghaiensis TaxID=262806 RepID=UPI0004131423|nr:AI-2E family transporter [Jonesia quinghaiensis]